MDMRAKSSQTIPEAPTLRQGNGIWASYEATSRARAEGRFVKDIMGATVHTVPHAENIATSGQSGHLCHLVIEGCLFRYKSLKRDRRQIVSFHVAGDLCGLLSADGFDYRTAGEATILSIPETLIARSAAESPMIARAVDRQMRLDAAIIGERIVSMGRRSARGRIAHLICETEARLRANGGSDDGRFKWPVTQTNLADVTGLSLVHLNKTLNGLRKDALLDWKGTVVTVIDRQRLWNEAEFDPAYLRCEDASFGAFFRTLAKKVAQQAHHANVASNSDAPIETANNRLTPAITATA